MELIFVAVALGLVAGLIPGPFSALIASTAIQSGLAAGIEVALVPLLTETPIMLLTAFVLAVLPLTFLRWVGLLGGLLLIVLSAHIFFRATRPKIPETKGRRSGEKFHVGQAILVAVVSPNPWLFWFFVGSPMILGAWLRSWTLGALTWFGYFGTFMATQLAIAWLAGHGHRRLTGGGRRRTMHGMGALILVAGCLLIWQAYVGNYDGAVRPQQMIERALEGPGSPES